MVNLKRTALPFAAAGLLSAGAWAGLAPIAQAAPSPAASSAAIAPAADGTWPAQVDRTPTRLKAGAALGYYLWHNANGWHMEVTHSTHGHVVFSGWLTTDGTLAVQRVDDERNDLTKLGSGRHELLFAFNNYGYLDGVHFETHGAQELTFHLYVDGAPVPPTHVFIGHANLHPTHVPFQINRTAIK